MTIDGRRYPARERRLTERFTFPDDHRCNDDYASDDHENDPFGGSDTSSITVSSSECSGYDDPDFIVDDSSDDTNSTSSYAPTDTSSESSLEEESQDTIDE